MYNNKDWTKSISLSAPCTVALAKIVITGWTWFASEVSWLDNKNSKMMKGH